MQTKQIAIFAAVGLGAYMLLSASKPGQARAPGTYAPIYPTRPLNTVGNMPGMTARQQLDATNNSLLYTAGRFLNGVFGGGSGSSQANSGATRQISNDDVPGQPGYGWRYYSDGTTIGPDGSYYSGGNLVYTPDSVAVNPPGGYEQPYTVDYTNDELIYWN